MGSADDARLSRQWAGASGWQGALARMCPLESTLAGTDVWEAQELLGTAASTARRC